MKSTYEILGWPNEIAITLFVLSLIGTLAPYTSGIDLGVFKVPTLPDGPRRACRYFGPILLFLSLVAFFPFWSSHRSAGSMTLDVFSGVEEHLASWPRLDTELSYVLEKSQGEIHISPVMGYQKQFNEGGPIEPIYFLDLDFPTLDIKVVNNTLRTIYLVEALFHIDRSDIDPAPLLVIQPHYGNAPHFVLNNEGWGKAGELKARFRLIPLTDEAPPPKFEEPYPHEVIVGDVVDFANVSVASAFEEEGADLKGLASLRVVRPLYDGSHREYKVRYKEGGRSITKEQFEARRTRFLGPFKNGGALVHGELIFSSRGISGDTSQKQVKFSTIVWLYDQTLSVLVGSVRSPSYEYGMKFDFQRIQYKRRVSISQILKPGESDRFTIKVGVERSSFHKFILELITNDEASIKSPPVVLHILVYRSAATYIRQTESDEIQGERDSR